MTFERQALDVLNSRTSEKPENFPVLGDVFLTAHRVIDDYQVHSQNDFSERHASMA